MELKKSHNTQFWITAGMIAILVIGLIFWVTSYDTLQGKFLLMWLAASIWFVTFMFFCIFLGMLIYGDEKGKPLTFKDLNPDIVFYLEKESLDMRKNLLKQWGYLYRISSGKESLILADWGLFEEGEYIKEASTEKIQKVFTLDIGKKKIIKKKVPNKLIVKPAVKKPKKKPVVKKEK